MTRILLAAVGRSKSPGLRRATRDYEARLSHYFRFSVVEVDAAGLADARADEARKREALALEKRIDAELELVVLTREGKPWSTRELSEYLGDMLNYGRGGAAFAIGGAHGLAPSLVSRARIRLSLSAMTLPHELARLILTEQLYRAGTMLRGEPYHKGP